MSIRRALSLIIIATAAAGALLALPGCAEKTDEQVIRDALTKELDGYKNHDADTVSMFADDMNLDELEVFGVNADEFARTYLEGFDHTIDEILVDEDTAQASVTISCKSYSSYLAALTSEKETLAARSANTKESVAARAEAAGDAMVEILRQIDVATCSPLIIRYDKIDNTWKPAESALHDVNMAMLTN